MTQRITQAYLLGQGIMGDEGDLEVGAYQLPPEVVLAAVGADALPHKVRLVHHDLPCPTGRGSQNNAVEEIKDWQGIVIKCKTIKTRVRKKPHQYVYTKNPFSLSA